MIKISEARKNRKSIRINETKALEDIIDNCIIDGGYEEVNKCTISSSFFATIKKIHVDEAIKRYKTAGWNVSICNGSQLDNFVTITVSEIEIGPFAFYNK